MKYISNAKVIKISKLLNKKDFNKDYTFIRIYSNFKKSKFNYNSQDLLLFLSA